MKRGNQLDNHAAEKPYLPAHFGAYFITPERDIMMLEPQIKNAAHKNNKLLDFS